jgi:cation:H+ antiporter
MSLIIAIGLFVVGAVLTIFATERLLEGLVSLATLLRISAFAIGAVLSGLEAENIAVGLASGGRAFGALALGTVFGGALFLLCVALGFSALFFPLEVRLPRSILLMFAASPVVAGLALVAPVTPRWTGVVLLVAFGASMIYLVFLSRKREFLRSKEVAESLEKRRPLWLAILLTLFGIVMIGVGGEMVAAGAQQLIAAFGVPALLMGMIVTPATIELEEVARQAIPSKRGRPDVSVGNLIGTLLYFVLCNLGLIVLITPVRVDPSVVRLDFPFLVVVTWGVTALLSYLGYIALHLLGI